MPDTHETTITCPTPREVRTERIFDATRERLFTAFTSPEVLPRWWGTGGATTTMEKADLTPGGEWELVEHAPDGSTAIVGGTYREVDPPARLVLTFEREVLPENVVVNTVRFEAIGGQTRVTIDSLFASTEQRDAMLPVMRQGFLEEYRALDRLLAADATTAQ